MYSFSLGMYYIVLEIWLGRSMPFYLLEVCLGTVLVQFGDGIIKCRDLVRRYALLFIDFFNIF